MSLSTLPIELLDAICRSVANADLVALSRTSSFLYPIAQRLLYRQLAISPAAHNLDVVVTLARKPDVARFVRAFSIVLDDKSPVFHAFYRALAGALASMTELTSLDLLVDSSTSWMLDQAFSRHYPRLRHVACSFALDSHVASFLERTPALEELELDSPPAHSPYTLPLLAPASIPRLVHFSGSSQAAKTIVPGRPLESIHIHDGDLTEDEIACFAKSTGHVVILGAITTALVVPLLQSLARHLPYLAYLRVMAPFHISTKVPDNSFYEQVANTLTMMPRLMDFEWSGMHWGSYQAKDKEDNRIWQSASLNVAVEHREDVFDFTSDFDFAFVY